MVAEIRITLPIARVLAAFVADPDGDHYGLELLRTTGLASGTLYPVLARLTGGGWLQKRWEDIDTVVAGRPARAYYRIAPEALSRARQRLAELHEQTRPAAGHIATKEATA